MNNAISRTLFPGSI